jgi:hypothetical protein
MSLHSWLKNIRSALAPRRDQRWHRRRGALRAATHRPGLEVLEDRTVPSFAAPVGYAADPLPSTVVTADFNQDGRLDLAVASSGGNTINVLLGNSNGTFGAASNYATGTSPRSLAVGDFNADGKLDLVTASSDSANVSILLGNGDGTFAPAQSLPAPLSSPLAVAVGDLNADGKMDLAVTGYNPGTPGFWSGDFYSGYVYEPPTPPTSEVTVLLGHGDGTFAASGSYDLGGDYVPAVATGDFNGDARVDLAWADQSAGAAGVLLGNGDGTFAAAAGSFATDAGPATVAVADLNGDGKLDLVTADGNSSASVLLGHGDGSFGAVQSSVIGGSPVALVVADFTGDGKPDLATANITDNSVGMLPGNGDGSFRNAQLYAAGSRPTALAAGDFNGDGRPDLAVADFSAGVSVLQNTGDWRSFQLSGFPSQTTAGQPHTLTVTAADADGNPLTGYTGTVHFSSSDPQAVLPADYTFTAADHGSHTFIVTLKSVWTQSITVTDTGPTAFTGSQAGIVVNPAAAARFQIDDFPSPLFVGDPGSFSVTAYDAYGNAATDYAGTVHFTSSDGLAVLPADYTFTGGAWAYFSATLRTAGPQSITVTDTASSGVTGSEAGIHVNPLATITGPNGGLLNQAVPLTLGATSGLPAGTPFTYAIDWNGDGVVDQTVTGPSGTTVNHTYATTGRYVVGVTATVHLGAEDYTSNTAQQSVTIFAVTVTVQADPGDASKSALVVQATAGADSLVLSPGAGNAVALSVSGTSVGSFSAPGGAAFAHVLVYGNGGADTIRLAGNLSVAALLFGGDGNDTLDAGGSTANNVLVGGAGNETIIGGSGRDLLIGGTGADVLRAGSGGALLIGGTTDYDANVQALLAIMKEWGRTDADYNTRIKHLNGSLGGGMNGSYRLTKSTVHDDSAIDNLYGGAGLDWFIVGNGKTKDRLFGQTSGEVVTTV